MVWFMTNIGTIIVGGILVIIVGLILRSMRKNKKKGKSTCGLNCAECSRHGNCH